MAQVSRQFEVPAERVFAVLSDPECYHRWVVGAADVVMADAGWPAVGTAFEHRVGIGPLRIADHTKVVASDPPRLLKLAAKARPLGTATVLLELADNGTGCTVTMTEEPRDGLTALFFNRLADPLVKLRNHESLRRLARLAEST